MVKSKGASEEQIKKVKGKVKRREDEGKRRTEVNGGVREVGRPSAGQLCLTYIMLVRVT